MNDIKKDKNNLDDEAERLKAKLSSPSSNPIDDVLGMMLKSDAKSCKLASAKLSQTENSTKKNFSSEDEKK